MASDNFAIADNGDRDRITQGDILVAKHHLPPSYLFVVMLLDPFGPFGGMPASRPSPQQMPETVFHVSESFFGRHVAIIVGPPPDHRIEFLDDLIDGGLAVGHQDIFEVSKMSLDLFLLGFDEQFSAKAADGEPQEIEAVPALDNPSFGLIK